MNEIHFHRRNLPHFDRANSIYFITYRLKGTIPLKILKHLKIQYLKNKEVATVVKESLHYFDKETYNLICYTIMKNHVHVVFHMLEKENDENISLPTLTINNSSQTGMSAIRKANLQTASLAN